MGARGMLAPALALWAGVLTGGWTGDAGFWIGAPLATLFAWIAFRAPDRVGTVAVLLACLAAATARGAAHERRMGTQVVTGVGEARPIGMAGRIVGHPWRDAEGGVAALRVTGGEGRWSRGCVIRLRLPGGSAVEWGDRVAVLAQVEAPRGRRSPGGYDAAGAMRAQGMVAEGRAVTIHRLGTGGGSMLRATFVRWRRALERVFERRLSDAAREVIVPLVIGDRSGLGPELATHLQASGLTHLIALSGLHVTWMSAVARGCTAAVGGGGAMRAWAGALCALFYLGIAGPLPSLARAAATETLATAARLRDRALDPVQALAVSAAILLAFAPGWARDLGFQLSCAATLGLTTLGAAWSAGRGRSGIATVPLRALAPTLAAHLAAQPLLLARFHAVPWTTLPANLVAVPVCELALAAAWLGCAVELVLPGWGGALFSACEGLCAALRQLARTAAAAPLALLPTGHGNGLVWLSAAGAALLCLALGIPSTRGMRPPGPARVHALALGWLASVLALALAITTPTLRPPPGRWWLVTLDVGQGDALALGFHDGWWLVDAGPRYPRFDSGTSIVLPFLRWAAVRRLEILALTHNHGDHAGGAPRVLEALPTGAVLLRAGWESPPLPGPDMRRHAARGDTLRRDPLVVVHWPPRGLAGLDENGGSLVLEVGEGAGRALLAADVDSLVEVALATAPGLAVLKVAHHGASRSSGERALATLRPRWAVISCGPRNPFGHPDRGALTRLAACGARVLRTDREGTVWLEIGPDDARRLDWKSATPGAALALPGRAACGRGALAGAPARW